MDHSSPREAGGTMSRGSLSLSAAACQIAIAWFSASAGRMRAPHDVSHGFGGSHILPPEGGRHTWRLLVTIRTHASHLRRLSSSPHYFPAGIAAGGSAADRD